MTGRLLEALIANASTEDHQSISRRSSQNVITILLPDVFDSMLSIAGGKSV